MRAPRSLVAFLLPTALLAATAASQTAVRVVVFEDFMRPT